MFNLFELNMQSILKDDNPVLREISKEVEIPLNKSDASLLNRMAKYIRDSNDEKTALEKHLEPAVGIAAIQVGSAKRFFVMIDVETEKEIYVINPVILKKSEQDIYIVAGEGCLSVPEKVDGYIYRAYEIEVEFFNMEGEKIKTKYKDMQAVIFQHEFDHLDGILYTDYIDKKNPYVEKEGAFEI